MTTSTGDSESSEASSVASILEQRFECTEIDDPIGEADILRFEKEWKRGVPEILRRLLLEVNGVKFEPPVEFRGLPQVWLLSLAGMGGVLSSYGDYAFPFLIPVATSLTGGSFFLDAQEPRTSKVYHLTPVAEYCPDRVVLEKVAADLEEFVRELRVMMTEE